VLVLVLVLRLVCLRKCGRFHEPEPKQRDQPEPWARAVGYSVGSAVCTHRQQSPRISAARLQARARARAQERVVWSHLIKLRVTSNTALPNFEVLEFQNHGTKRQNTSFLFVPNSFNLTFFFPLSLIYSCILLVFFIHSFLPSRLENSLSDTQQNGQSKTVYICSSEKPVTTNKTTRHCDQNTTFHISTSNI
jgi:hypothetical protein